MFRPMASSVSVLSDIVANSHQTIHSVSSAPSEIPYGGFSPVRLQTRRQSATFAHGLGLGLIVASSPNQISSHYYARLL